MQSNHSIRSLLLGLLTITLGCSGGSGDITGTSPLVTVSFAVDSQQTLLGTELTYHATFHSFGGFSGPVTFSVDSLPTGWTVNTGGSNVVVLAAGVDHSRDITIDIATDADPAAFGHTLVLHAVTASNEYFKPFKLTVVNEFILPIALGTVDGPHWGTRVNQILNMRVGATLTFQNDDTVPHTIHATAAIAGFNHQADPGMAPLGGQYSSTFTGAGEDNFYCHAHGDSDDKVHLVVQ